MALPLLPQRASQSLRRAQGESAVSLEKDNGLAIVYKEQGQFDEAEQLLLEAVEGRILKLGDTLSKSIIRTCSISTIYVNSLNNDYLQG
jgi:hypothetical protein